MTHGALNSLAVSLTKIVNDELTELMGGSVEELQITANPTVILIAGLNGSGFEAT